jgi:hypothetical protein
MAFATPTWMWIGRFCADSVNGEIPLPYAQNLANTFFAMADQDHPNGPAPIDPYPGVYFTGNSCTHSTICGNGNLRNSCDFIFIFTHGSPGFCSVVNENSPYHNGWPFWDYEMDFGTESYGGTIWVYIFACQVLKHVDYAGQNFWGDWCDAFRGVQCILGFSSDAGYTGVAQNTLPLLFWDYWTGSHGCTERSIKDAHFNSVHDLLMTYGWWMQGQISPAILSTDRPGDNHPFYQDSYHSATSAQGNSPCPNYYFYEEYTVPQ